MDYLSVWSKEVANVLSELNKIKLQHKTLNVYIYIVQTSLLN